MSLFRSYLSTQSFITSTSGGSQALCIARRRVARLRPSISIGMSDYTQYTFVYYRCESHKNISTFYGRNIRHLIFIYFCGMFGENIYVAVIMRNKLKLITRSVMFTYWLRLRAVLKSIQFLWWWRRCFYPFPIHIDRALLQNAWGEGGGDTANRELI